MNRRGFMGAMGGAAVAGRKMAEEVAIRLTGHIADNGGLGPYTYPMADGPATGNAENSRADWKRGLASKFLRPQLESLLYECHRQVTRIDPDIGVMRSFSLNAKVTFQRQRNVERDIETRQSEYPYTKMQNLIKGFLRGLV